MALIKYIAAPPPVTNMRVWLAGELRRIELSNTAIINVLAALGDKPIELGAPDSGGIGFRMLRIPN